MTATNGAHEGWLNCLLDEGMFSDEIAVSYPPEGKILRSVFVPVSAVRGLPGNKGSVRVKLMKQSGKILAILPTEQPEIVAVSEQDISESP